MTDKKSETLREWVVKQKIELKSKINKFDVILKLIDTKYPDLRKSVNRWSKIRYASAKANESVSSCDISHNCGCCVDSSLEVWPYLIDEATKIYSDPPSFQVAEKNQYGYGEIPYPNWEEKMREADINERVISKVEKYLEDNPPIYEDDEDEDY
jgi:hypothetical protein